MKIIDKLYGDWLNIWYELSQKNNKPALNQLIGNLPSLTDYMNGRSSQLLHIPIPFYFCKYKGLALPLIALEYSDVKINVEFEDADKCYMLGPSHYIQCVDDIVNFILHFTIENFTFIFQNPALTNEINEYHTYFKKLSLLEELNDMV